MKGRLINGKLILKAPPVKYTMIDAATGEQTQVEAVTTYDLKLNGDVLSGSFTSQRGSGDPTEPVPFTMKRSRQ